jgi:hypothetical protein
MCRAQEGYDLDDIIGTSHYWHSIGVDLSHFACVPSLPPMTQSLGGLLTLSRLFFVARAAVNRPP